MNQTNARADHDLWKSNSISDLFVKSLPRWINCLGIHSPKYPNIWLSNILLKMQDSGVELRVCPETKKRMEEEEFAGLGDLFENNSK